MKPDANSTSATQDLHLRWPHRWLSPKAECRTSELQGLGIFAREPIGKGEAVSVLGGVIVHRDDIREYRKLMGHIGIQIHDLFFIVPTTRDELTPAGTINHSCAPNLACDTSLTFVAIQDIPAGEELVFDYATSESFDFAFDCRCGAPECRKRITQDDWKNPELQKRLGPYFSPYLKEKIRQL